MTSGKLLKQTWKMLIVAHKWARGFHKRMNIDSHVKGSKRSHNQRKKNATEAGIKKLSNG